WMAMCWCWAGPSTRRNPAWDESRPSRRDG
ncbi:MAG: hypothetical protein AVDCRST_MAG15-2218, partial [uncultured Rubellimicrobium sp.]